MHREEKIGQRPQLLSHFRFGFRKGEDKGGGSVLGGGAHPSGGPGARALGSWPPSGTLPSCPASAAQMPAAPHSSSGRLSEH